MKIPKHVGVILDGNRRWAKTHGKVSLIGHKEGVENVSNLFTWSKEAGIRQLTLYIFSKENYDKRSKQETDYLMKLFRQSFDDLKNKIDIDKHQVKLRFIGQISLLPDTLQSMMNKMTDETRHYDKYTINFAIMYGGRAEIVDAVRRISDDISSGKVDPSELDEVLFSNYLYMKDEPDLIIRTGNAVRTSNFLTWQSAYSEWYFSEKMWPEFTKQDFLDAMKEFSRRERRFGA